ncbi:MAG TPA: type VI secretion system-associated FHA domain protein TagH [Woeseiaceae bacterium]|nr:type VI secretion system-associated FHA domain protein TagH [Woeseiaceae bacterium]
MPLQLEIISEHRDIVGDDAVHEFSEDGGTIGRALENEWILPDPDRYISGCHAAIDHKGGIYYLADLSTNGVYVNDEYEPIGKGNPRRLFNGDHLRMGNFEMRVAIDQGESIVMPQEGEQTVVPDRIELQVPEVSLVTGVQLLDEEAITGDEEFEFALASIRPAVPVPIVAAPEPEPAREPEVNITAREKAPVTPEDLFDSFLDGVGVSRADLHPDIDPVEVMQNAGEVLKEFVEGINRLLASRSNLKMAFSLDQTTILPRHNNPLKLSQNVQDSIKQLLVGHEGEYLGPRDAVREACRDLLHHQDAFIDAMSAAFTEFADRFEPDELLAGFNRNLDAKPLLGFLNKLKYWQLYCDLYPVLTNKGDGRYPQLLAEEFVKSYERQIAEFKRQDAARPVPSTTATRPAAPAATANEPAVGKDGYFSVFDDIDTDFIDFIDEDPANPGSSSATS